MKKIAQEAYTYNVMICSSNIYTHVCMYVCMYVCIMYMYLCNGELNVIGNYMVGCGMVGYDGSVAIPHMFPTKRAIMK